MTIIDKRPLINFFATSVSVDGPCVHGTLMPFSSILGGMKVKPFGPPKTILQESWRTSKLLRHLGLPSASALRFLSKLPVHAALVSCSTSTSNVHRTFQTNAINAHKTTSVRRLLQVMLHFVSQAVHLLQSNIPLLVPLDYEPRVPGLRALET